MLTGAICGLGTSEAHASLLSVFNHTASCFRQASHAGKAVYRMIHWDARVHPPDSAIKQHDYQELSYGMTAQRGFPAAPFW